jgi:hypothetical protein
MRPVSKREIGFRFGLVNEVRVPVIRRERKGAEAKVDGVACHRELSRDEWNDLASPGVVRTRLAFVPERQGDGWQREQGRMRICRCSTGGHPVG